MPTTTEKSLNNYEANLDKYPRIEPLTCLRDALQSVDNPEERARLATIQENLENGNIGDAENAYLDYVAVALFSDNTLPQNVDDVKNRLAIVSAALSGNTDAQKHLDTRLAARERTEIEQHSRLTDEVLELASHHVLVHRTNYPPHRDESGTVTLQSTAEATKGGEPRNTIHFAIDHAATNPFGMQYGGKYTIVAPFDAALQANAHPGGFKGVDTFFAVGPGEDVVLPGATILEGVDDDSITAAIRKYGAEPTVSDGQSVYSGVDKQIEAIATLLGHKSALHVDTMYDIVENKALLMQRGLADDVDTNALFRNLAAIDSATQRQYLLSGFVPIPIPYAPHAHENSGV